MKNPLSNPWPFAEETVGKRARRRERMESTNNGALAPSARWRGEVSSTTNQLQHTRGATLVVAVSEQTKDECEELLGEVGGVIMCSVEPETRFI